MVDFLGLPVGQFPDKPDDLASVGVVGLLRWLLWRPCVYIQVLLLWYRKRSVGGSLVDIVEALMLTRGLGRHVALLCKNGSHTSLYILIMYWSGLIVY